MKSECKTALLYNIASIQTGPFGSQLHKKDYVQFGTPIVTVEHLGEKNFSRQNLPYVSDYDTKRLRKYLLSVGDIVFSRVGSVDRCSYVGDDNQGWLFSGRCLRVRPNRDSISPEFLYYFFTLNSTKQLISSIAVGATMPSINTALLGEVKVHFPPLRQQQAIESVFSCLDKKIQLNRQINHNLPLAA